MPKKPEPPPAPVPGSEEEWEIWEEFSADAKVLAKRIKCTRNVALILLALNEVAQMLQRPDDDEPWRGGKSK